MAEPSNSQPEASAPEAPLRSPVRVALVTPGDAAPAPLLEALAERGVDLERARSVFDAMAIVTRAAACLRARQRDSRDESPADEASAAPVALLIVEPSRISRADELVAAVQRYAPGVVIWRYDATSAIPLRGYDGHGARSRSARGSAEAPERSGKGAEAPAVVTKRARPVSEPPTDAPPGASRAGESAGQPRLRLTDPMDDVAPPATQAPTQSSHGADADERDLEGELPAGASERDAMPPARPGEDALLTPEELAMLLGEEDDGGGVPPRSSP